MADLPIGTILAYALTAANIPDRWLLCDGSAIPAADYQELITLLGSPNTPNLAGRTLIGTGQPSTGLQGDNTAPNFPPGQKFLLNYTGGEYHHTLTEAEMPSHRHTLVYRFDLSSACHAGTGSMPCLNEHATNYTNNTGGGAAHNTMQPYVVVNYIIYGGPAA